MDTEVVWSNELRKMIACSFCSNCHARYADKRIEAQVKRVSPKVELANFTCRNCQKVWYLEYHHDYSDGSGEIEADELIDLHDMLSAPAFEIETITHSKRRPF